MFRKIRVSQQAIQVVSRGLSRNVAAPRLLDKFNRHHTYLRISITERCNLRCQYCMPEAGVELTPSSDLLTTSEIISLVKVFASQGVNKVRLTGGEPLVNKDIIDLIGQIKGVEGIDTVALTTNGVTLSRHLPALLSAGLDNVNISLDTMAPHKFQLIARRPAGALQKVMRGIDDAVNSNLSVKLNNVVMKGVNEDEICNFVSLTKDRPLSVRFLEFMPFSGNAWSQRKFIPYQEQMKKIEEEFELTRLEDEASSTSMNYAVNGHAGNIGFISSMSRNFCGGCNRLRLTHDGNLKVCLFGKDEVSLRDILRSSDPHQLTDVIHAAVLKKNFSHGGAEQIKKDMKRPMILIGRKTPFPVISSHGYHTYCSPSNRITSPSNRTKCTLSHVESSGKARMVDVGGKVVSDRVAIAQSVVLLSDTAYTTITENSNRKGSVLTVAQIAGIQAAKQTSHLIPLCHQINLNKVQIDFNLQAVVNNSSELGGSRTSDMLVPELTGNVLEGSRISNMVRGGQGSVLVITCTVSCSARTGVEMEALVGASVAALTVYDMCKAVDKGAEIACTRVVHKSGGKGGSYSL